MMTLQHLRNYAWFVFLMTLVIGWSGVSIAQTPMQHDLHTMPCHSEQMKHHSMHIQADEQTTCHQSMGQVFTNMVNTAKTVTRSIVRW